MIVGLLVLNHTFAVFQISLDVDVVGSRVDINVAEHSKYLQQLSDQCSTVLRDSLDVIVKRIKLQDHCLTKTIHRGKGCCHLGHKGLQIYLSN